LARRGRRDRCRQGQGGHLVTKSSYKNFMIYSEFWADEEANSGIFIRCKDPKAIGARTCYEVTSSTNAPTRHTGPVRLSISPR